MEGQDRAIPTIFATPLIQVLVVGLLMVALLNGQRDLTLLALLILGTVFGTKLWARSSLSGIQSHFQVDKRKGFSDETFRLKINVENRKFLPVWLQIKVPIPRAIDSSSGERELIKEDSLLWRQKARFEWELILRRRGVHPIGPPMLRAGDLFAFFSREKETEEIHQIIVYPRIIPLKKFSLPRRDFFGIPGSKSAVRDPIYILGTRDYQNGQPAKHIHWKASARHHRLQEKVFEPTAQEKVLMAVEVSDFAGRQAEEEFERTLEIAASLAVRMDKRGCAVGLVTNGAIFGGGSPIVPIGRTPEQLPAILEVLARLQMETQGDLLDVVRRGLELRWGVSCVHFSLQADRTIGPAGEFFRQRKIPAMFLTCRPDLMARKDRSEAWPKVIGLDDISFPKNRSTKEPQSP